MYVYTAGTYSTRTCVLNSTYNVYVVRTRTYILVLLRTSTAVPVLVLVPYLQVHVLRKYCTYMRTYVRATTYVRNAVHHVYTYVRTVLVLLVSTVLINGTKY